MFRTRYTVRDFLFLFQIMSVPSNQDVKYERILGHDPQVRIFLQPIAPPAALGLAGFAGSTWITATFIARWWGSEESPTIFFPFVAFWGGLGQFIAGLFGYAARDTLITVIHVLWGSFWMSIGLLYLLVVSLYFFAFKPKILLLTSLGNGSSTLSPNR